MCDSCCDLFQKLEMWHLVGNKNNNPMLYLIAEYNLIVEKYSLLLCCRKPLAKVKEKHC